MTDTTTSPLAAIEDVKATILQALQKQDTCNEDTPWPEVVIDLQHDHATWVEAAYRLRKEGKVTITVNHTDTIRYVVLQVTEAGKQK